MSTTLFAVVARFLRLLGVVALGLMLLPAQVANAKSAGHIDLWPQLTILSDPTHQLSLAQAMARGTEFTTPKTPYANLGPRTETVWVRVPVSTPAGSPSAWWLVIDYPSLDEAEVHVVSNSVETRSVMLGDRLTVNERPAQTRPHAVQIDVPASGKTELWLKVRTTGPMILPITLQRTTDFLLSESAIGVLQGSGIGFGLCILMYTLAAAVFTREPLYLWYSIAVGATTLFHGGYVGLAPMLLWPDSLWLTQKTLLLLTLTILATGSLFVERALDFRNMSPRLGWCMHAVVFASVATAAAFASDVMDYRATMLATAVIGPLPMLLSLPVAYRRARQGDQAAYWMFAGFVMYSGGVIVASGLARGTLPSNGWFPYAYQFSSMLQAVAWLMILNVRVADMRRQAAQAMREHDRVLMLSQTDALTGLLNRRGLHLALHPLLEAAGPGRFVGIYLMDLDGFKPVNDTHGHEAGDELLIQVGQRLKDAVRAGDIVARMGGDEFVVIASQLRGEVEAEQVGQKLLSCCEAPFVLPHAQVRVGLTVGYAMSPQDGREAEALLRRADAAMYGGKHAGKGRVCRATDSVMSA